MANKNVELMRGNPEKAVKTLAIPIMISMLLTASYNIIDGIWVAGLGQAAIAGIGFVTPIFMILNGASVGLGSGATSSISRSIGARDHKRANQTASHALFLFLIASIILTAILLLIQKPLLLAYGADGQSLIEAQKYGTVLFLGLIGFIFSNGSSGILRGEGDMKRAMYAMITSVGLNAILDPIFIYILGFGSAGAAMATVFSSIGAASVILYWILIKKDTYVDVDLRKFKFNSKIAKDILKVGIPASIDMIVMSISMGLYMIFISSIGGEFGIASFTSGQRLYLFAVMPVTAIGTAVTAVTGSAYGAQNGDYISRAHKFGAKFGASFGICIIIIFLIFANQLATLFAYTSETAALVPEIANFLRITGLCLPFMGLGMASSFFYQGIGRGVISLCWTIVRELIFAVTFTYLLGIYFNIGLIGIWAGLGLGRALASILNYTYARHTIRNIRKEIGT